MSDKELKVVFAPGCFDNFDGTQEELDEMMKEIMEMAKNGTLFENSTRVDMDDLDDEDAEAVAEMLARHTPTGERKVH